MRIEIERPPEREKSCMLEAQAKCKATREEFGDARLEKFLRCEGMNVELAAMRFARYWEKRREIFGPDKYALRMTLSEALRDDLIALEAGVFSLLLLKDLSGRQLLFFYPHRHSRRGYTSESMLRAMWYVAEVSAQDNTDIGGGHIGVVWDRETTFWDYDQKVFDGLPEMLEKCMPVRTIAIHSCCPPRIVTCFAFPFIRAVMCKEVLHRFTVHDVPESEIIQVLDEYGITRDMLPIEMGGTVELNQVEWLENWRAVEMEEI